MKSGKPASPTKRWPDDAAQPPTTITPAQWRMARAGLNLTAQQLARRANVGIVMVKRLEAGEVVVPWTVRDLRSVLESAGVEFIAENGGGAGVRLRKGAKHVNDTG